MKNINPLFLLEGKYLDKLIIELNKSNPELVEQLFKNGIKDKGGALRNDIAVTMRRRMGWDHLSKERKQVRNLFRLGKPHKAESETLSKLAKGGQVDSMGRDIPGNQKSFNTAVKDTIDRGTPKFPDSEAIYEDIPDDSIANIIRKWFKKPLKTHRVRTGFTHPSPIPPKTPYVFSPYGSFGADYVI